MAGLLLSTLVGACAANGAPSLYASSAYNSGAVLVRFPTDSPSVQLVQDSNPTVNSMLNVTHVLELAPLNSTHPLVYLAADPASTSAFNVSQSGGVGRFDLGLNGTLGVRYAGFNLWSGSGPSLSTLATNPAKGQAELAIAYRVLPTTTNVQGVSLNWSIQDWPWLSASDLLGLELEFAVPNGTGFSSCLGAAATCSGSALAPGGIVWSSSTTGSVGSAAPDGTVASLSWNSTAAAATHHRVGVTAGTFYASAGVDRVTLAIPGNGSSNVNGSATFLLQLPLPPAPLTVSGSLPLYVAALVGGSLLALIAVGRARRRDRELLETL
ncbi:MAG TPA: hypothetical protein VGU43_01620 [Thermoplasmata archaeon]|nr:hypothetical protein [Thermoplasmata archaeon]